VPGSLAFGIIAGILAATPAGFGPAGAMAGLAAGLAVAAGTWLAAALVLPLSWPVSLAFAQLAARGPTPARLMRFLEDARDRNVLRAIGPVYQFRHARLQDRLAEPGPHNLSQDPQSPGQQPARAAPSPSSASRPAAPKGGGVSYRLVHQASMITSWAMPVSMV
jgi:hypothetical protein